MKRFILILILLTTFMSVSANSVPKIYLATIGPGDELFLRWGHFAIVVEYEDSVDRLYDYGNFSFQQDDFVKNFIKGVMTYFKYVKSADYELGSYKADNRTITLQELNLTDEQALTYVNKLKEETKHENMFYQYDHYYNNCVSQMSDFLDELTDGAFYEGTSNLTGRTFRDFSRDYTASNFINNALIMFLLGSKIDHVITEKEAMFLPDYTRERASKVMIPNGNGGFKPLVKNTIVPYQSIDRDPVIVNAKPTIMKSLLVGIIIAIIILIINMNRISSGILSIITGFSAGIGGSVLFFMAFFTGHYYIHQNWNLIMVNPLSFIILISGVMKLSKRLYTKGHYLSTLYIDITLLLTVVMILLKSLGIIHQANGESIALILPLLLVNSSFISLFKNQTGKNIRFSSKPDISDAASVKASLEDSITTD